MVTVVYTSSKLNGYRSLHQFKAIAVATSTSQHVKELQTHCKFELALKWRTSFFLTGDVCKVNSGNRHGSIAFVSSSVVPIKNYADRCLPLVTVLICVFIMDLVTFEACGSFVPLLEFRALIVANGPVINVIQVERAIRLSRNVAAMLNLRKKPWTQSGWNLVWKTVNYIRTAT